MWHDLTNRLFADPQGDPALIRRAVRDYGVRYWKRYAVAFAWMAVSAACLAATTYLIGGAVNRAYIDRSFIGVAVIAISFVFLFSLKGIATYAQAVTMSRINNEMTAENQRLVFDKLLQQDLSFFSDRHSSEFTARTAHGASAVSNVLGMLVSALGRDALSLIGLIGVMIVLNPLLSLIGFLV